MKQCSVHPNHWPGPILASPSTWLVTESCDSFTSTLQCQYDEHESTCRPLIGKHALAVTALSAIETLKVTYMKQTTVYERPKTKYFCVFNVYCVCLLWNIASLESRKTVSFADSVPSSLGRPTYSSLKALKIGLTELRQSVPNSQDVADVDSASRLVTSWRTSVDIHDRRPQKTRRKSAASQRRQVIETVSVPSGRLINEYKWFTRKLCYR